jgi:hypothetical protein
VPDNVKLQNGTLITLDDPGVLARLRTVEVSPGVHALLLSGQDAANASLAAILAAISGTAPSPVTITRPSNTDAYIAGDVIGDTNGSAILSFTLTGSAGGHVWICGADLRWDLSAVPSGMTSWRLHLFDAAPTAIADNAAFDLPSGDRAAYLGYIDLPTIVDVGSTLWVQQDNIYKKIKLAAASTTLYGLLVTNGGYTPGSGSVARIRLHTVSAGA